MSEVQRQEEDGRSYELRCKLGPRPEAVDAACRLLDWRRPIREAIEEFKQALLKTAESTMGLVCRAINWVLAKIKCPVSKGEGR